MADPIEKKEPKVIDDINVQYTDETFAQAMSIQGLKEGEYIRLSEQQKNEPPKEEPPVVINEPNKDQPPVPPVDTPPVPPVDTPPATPDTKPADVPWSEYFGESVKSKDDVLAKIKKAEELEAQTKLLNEKLLAEQTKNPFEGNEDLYRLAKLRKDKPEEADIYKQIVMGDLNEMDLLRLDLVKKYPDLYKNDEEGLAAAMIQRDYPELFGEDADPDSQDYKLAKLKFRQDALNAKDRWMKDFNAIEVPSPVDPKVKELQKTELTQAWSPVLKDLFSRDSEYPLFVQDKETGEQKEFFKITLPKEMLSKHVDQAAEHLASQGIEVNQKNMLEVATAISESVKNQLLIEKMYEYGKAQYEAGAEAEAKKVNGIPSDDATDKPPVNPVEEKTDDQKKMGDFFSNNY